MFKEVKSMLPVSGNRYDEEIIMHINGAVLDLTRTAHIVLPGAVDITRNDTTGEITDNSTISDQYVLEAIAVYCNMHIFNPPNMESLERAYKNKKGSMQLSKYYNGTAVTTE